ERRALRAVVPALVLIIAADFVSLGHEQFPLAFCIPPAPSRFPGPPVPDIVNVRDGLGFACVQRGYGVIRGYEPRLRYRRDPRTAALGKIPTAAARRVPTQIASSRPPGAPTG